MIGDPLYARRPIPRSGIPAYARRPRSRRPSPQWARPRPTTPEPDFETTQAVVELEAKVADGFTKIEING